MKDSATSPGHILVSIPNLLDRSSVAPRSPSRLYILLSFACSLLGVTMEAKTALELWNDGVEGRLDLQLYHCDVDSLMQGGPATSPFHSSKLRSPGYQKLFGDILHTRPLKLFDQLDSPTYEELFEQNWQLFEESDQEPESFCAHKSVPEDMDSPKVIYSVMPEPTCLTKVIQAMVMYPPSVKKVPKKRKKKNWAGRKKSRLPRAMVSDDENDDEVVSAVQDPPGGIADYGGFQEPKRPIAGSSSTLRRGERMENIPWSSRLGIPTSSQVLLAPPNAASEVVPSFAEHLARCAVDWDYPEVLSMRGYVLEPVSQRMAPPQTGKMFARPASAAQPLTPIALEQKSTTALGASNKFSRKKRSASSDLSADERLHGPRISASRNVGLENLEPITMPVPRQNKRRRLVS